MTPEEMSKKLVCTAHLLARSSKCLEEELKKTLARCQLISEDLCRLVAQTLMKLCSDLAGAPLVLHRIDDDPRKLSASLKMIEEVLKVAQPESLSTEQQLQETLRRVTYVCADADPSVKKVSQLLVGEVYVCFQRFRRLFGAFAKKTRNLEILEDRVLHFFWRTRSQISTITFCLLKLSVCLQAAADGCFELNRKDALQVKELLSQTSRHSRAFASLMVPHRELLTICLEAVIPERPQT